MWIFLKWQVLAALFVADCASQEQPNVLFVMVDDMGWNDVSFHGLDQIMTPNLDAMAYKGVILQQYYSEAICTPARSALLTGKYPMRIGMHGVPLLNSEDRGIFLTEKLLPTYMKDKGYATHLVGKWHVGMSRKEYLPTSRGYDSHYGLRGGIVDFYTYNNIENTPNGTQLFGIDLFDDFEPQENEQRYIVDALTDRAVKIITNHNKSQPLFLHVAHNAPHAGDTGAALQHPPYTTLRNKHIAHTDRRLYADMITHLDASFGELVTALKNNNMLESTIVAFVSDNGAPTYGKYANWGVNLPFRSQKWSPWEGGVRVPAFVWYHSLKPKMWDGLMHVTDWLPTLVSATGGKITKKIDGVNQWDSIKEDGPSSRKDVVISIDNMSNYAAYRLGDYKIILGNMTNSEYNDYLGETFLTLKSETPDYLNELLACDTAKALNSIGQYLSEEEVKVLRQAATVRQLDPIKDSKLCVPSFNRGCLYNVRIDPSESHDLWDSARPIADLLRSKLVKLWNEQIPRKPPHSDVRADPSLTQYVWRPWLTGDTQSINKFIDKNYNSKIFDVESSYAI